MGGVGGGGCGGAEGGGGVGGVEGFGGGWVSEGGVGEGVGEGEGREVVVRSGRMSWRDEEEEEADGWVVRVIW